MPMAASITVPCPNPRCGKQMRAAVEHVGKKARCPWCKSRFEIKLGAEAGALGTLPLSKSDDTTASRLSRSTDVNPWLSGLIGVVLTGLVYLVVLFPLRGSYVGRLFENGGPVSVANTIITCWGLAALALKYLAVKRQLSYAELELDLIPLEIGLEITPTNVDQFLGHLRGLSDAQRNSIPGRRILGALEHFKSRNSVPEVQQYVATQAEIDASSVDSGYTMLRSFIWANPILGFLGTVVGISFAVSGLSASFAAGGGTESLMQGLGQVTSGLATAFDTTLIGLVFAMFLLFPTESLRRTEYGMLDRIEVFANESLLRRLSDDRGQNYAEMPTLVRDTLDAAFREHQRWLAQWQSQVGELGQVIGHDFEEVLLRIQGRQAEMVVAHIDDIRGLASMFDEMFRELLRCGESWTQSQRKLLQSLETTTIVRQSPTTSVGHDEPPLQVPISISGSGIPAAAASDDAHGLENLANQVGRLVERLDAILTKSNGSPREGSLHEESTTIVQPNTSLPPMVSLLPSVAPEPRPGLRSRLADLFRLRGKKRRVDR